MMPSTGWKNVFSVQKFGTEHHLLHTLGYVLNWCSDEIFLLLCAQKQFHSKAFTFCRIHGVHSWAQTHTRTACSNWYSLRFFTSKKFMQSIPWGKKTQIDSFKKNEKVWMYVCFNHLIGNAFESMARPFHMIAHWTKTKTDDVYQLRNRMEKRNRSTNKWYEMGVHLNWIIHSI